MIKWGLFVLKKYQNLILIIQNEINLINNYICECLNSNFIFLPKDLKNFLLNKSKKIRSVLAILFIKAKYGKISDKQLKVLSVAEMIHNASLIHDDIIDEAKFRRKELTVNSLFGNGSAVIIGDYVLSISLKELNGFENTRLTNLFINSLYEICKGEFEQDFMKNKILTIEEYVKKSERKTAELFKTALTGALIVENQQDIIDLAEKFAENFGIMFQIKNDLVNFSNVEKMSELAKNDFDNGIFTAPIIYLNEITDFAKIKNIKNDNSLFSYAVNKTNNLINLYSRKTLDLISSFPDNDYKTALINLCTEVQKGKNV